MAISTYAELKAAVKEWSDRADLTDPQISNYVVLAEAGPVGLAGLLSQSDIVPIAAGVAGLSVVMALVVGLGIFAVMTRKLERLTGAMDEFQRRDFGVRPQTLNVAKHSASDEIDRLAITFSEMAARMTAQLQTLRQNDQLRRELVANVSHDLKTPIATLHARKPPASTCSSAPTGRTSSSYSAPGPTRRRSRRTPREPPPRS